jgi:hypothetical protein
LVFLSLLLIGTAAAEEEQKFNQVKQFDLQVQDNTVISTIEVTNLEPDSEQNFTMKSFSDDKVYQMNVSSVHTGPSSDLLHRRVGWWDFNISLTYPNGTTQYQTLDTFHSQAYTYDLYIQYVQGVEGDTAFDVNVYLAMIPMRSSFTSLTTQSDVNLNQTIPEEYQYKLIPLSSVEGQSTTYMDVAVHSMSMQEFDEHRENSISRRVSEGISDIFSWTWDSVLNAASKIPFVGKHLESSLKIAGMLIDEILFWFDFLILKNWEITVLTFETVIIADAIYYTKSLPALFRRLIENHVKVVEFTISLINTITSIIGRIFLAIGNLIQSIKPT